jgi:hypothetical protein
MTTVKSLENLWLSDLRLPQSRAFGSARSRAKVLAEDGSQRILAVRGEGARTLGSAAGHHDPCRLTPPGDVPDKKTVVSQTY